MKNSKLFSVLFFISSAISQVQTMDKQQHVISNHDQPLDTLGDEMAVMFENDKVFRISLASRDQIQYVEMLSEKMNLDIWKDAMIVDESLNIYSMDIRVSSSKLDSFMGALDMRGIGHEVMIANVQALVDESAPFESFREYSPEDLALNVEDDEFLKSYHQMDDIHTFMETIVGTFPSLVQFEIIGITFENRPIMGLRFGKDGNKRKIVYHGGQHAREWIGVATMTYFIRQLATGYGKVERITKMLNEFDITIIPVLNVDGYEFTHSKNRMWRKNRQPNGGFCIGTDPNRNWNSSWAGSNSGSSGNPCSEAYHGSAPFSAPETRAIADYIRDLQRENEVVSYIDFHAYSQLWMFPFGSSCQRQPKEVGMIETAGMKASAALQKELGTKFKVGSVCRIIYQANGGSLDWTYENGVAFSYGVELRDTGRYGFLLPPSQIIPSGKETLEAVLALNEFIAENVK